MARTLIIRDGSVVPILGDPRDVLQRLIDEHLGMDCAELFRELLDQAEDW